MIPASLPTVAVMQALRDLPDILPHLWRTATHPLICAMRRTGDIVADFLRDAGVRALPIAAIAPVCTAALIAWNIATVAAPSGLWLLILIVG